MNRPPTNETATVETVSLENACNKFGLPSFVKVDAEGAEIEILAGAKHFLNTQSIQFVLDTSHFRNGRTTDQAVEAILRECGYHAESSVDFGGFMTTWAQKQLVS